MRIEYISHSCFVIETNGTKIAFDPWIKGSAYHQQWHLYPKPAETRLVENADIVLISHGHEDHFHAESLKRIQKDAHIFFPFQWREGVVSYLNHLTFSAITEAISFQTYEVNGIKITYLGYSMESIIVVECEGFVIVNINDALNSNHETAVEFLLNRIKKQWTKIDFLFSGWSGAGYFPNKVHYKTKNDTEVALIREQYFADNFCRFTKHLNPDIAVAFAPGFVLLNNENRWINDIKFPRQMTEKYYRDNFDNSTQIQFPITYPGDYFMDKTFYKTSSYHTLNNDKEIYGQIDTVFKNEIALANQVNMMPESEMPALLDKLTFWLNKNKVLYHKNVLEDAIFSIVFTDVEHQNCFNVNLVANHLTVTRSENVQQNIRLRITTKAQLLSQSLDKMWGGDMLSIGYGIDVEVFEELTLEKNLDIVCVRLISRYPIYKDDLLKNPSRVLKYYFHNPALTNLWISQKIKLRPYVNKYPFNDTQKTPCYMRGVFVFMKEFFLVVNQLHLFN